MAVHEYALLDVHWILLWTSTSTWCEAFKLLTSKPVRDTLLASRMLVPHEPLKQVDFHRLPFARMVKFISSWYPLVTSVLAAV